MTLFNSQGHTLGRVAALLEDAGRLSHLLLSDPAAPHRYRLIPIERISAVKLEGVFLTLEQHELSSLDVHDPQS